VHRIVSYCTSSPEAPWPFSKALRCQRRNSCPSSKLGGELIITAPLFASFFFFMVNFTVSQCQCHLTEPGWRLLAFVFIIYFVFFFPFCTLDSGRCPNG
jgi:hypothetical protein